MSLHPAASAASMRRKHLLALLLLCLLGEASASLIKKDDEEKCPANPVSCKLKEKCKGAKDNSKGHKERGCLCGKLLYSMITYTPPEPTAGMPPPSDPLESMCEYWEGQEEYGTDKEDAPACKAQCEAIGKVLVASQYYQPHAGWQGALNVCCFLFKPGKKAFFTELGEVLGADRQSTTSTTSVEQMSNAELASMSALHEGMAAFEQAEKEANKSPDARLKESRAWAAQFHDQMKHLLPDGWSMREDVLNLEPHPALRQQQHAGLVGQ